MLEPTGIRRLGIAILSTLAVSACGPVATGGGRCSTVSSPVPLPPQLSEASGVAVSLRHPGVFWTHNDSGRGLYAVDEEGSLLGEFRLDRRTGDWEDLALASCGGGEVCLYAGDLGDNYEERVDRAVLRMREPDPSAPGEVAAERFPVRFPDGPRDVEALLVLPGERVLVVTKGRNHPITVYRYPGELRPDTVTLQEVQRLSDGPRIFPRMITGGSVSPEGNVVVLRTYESLRFFRFEADTLAPMDDDLVNLRPLREIQGEGVGLGLGGLLALTSEAGPAGRRSSLALLRCRLDRG